MKKCTFLLIFVTFTLISSSFSQIEFQGDLRTRADTWQWFRTPGYNDNYTYFSTLLRLRFSDSSEQKNRWTLEIGQAAVGGVPENARAPGAKGSLGPGAMIKAINGENKASLFIKQAYVDFDISHYQIRAGRTDFADGAEMRFKEPNLAWIRQNRASQRVVGRNGDSLTQRTYDGIRFQKQTGNQNWTLFLAHPVEGTNELDVVQSLTRVSVCYLSFTQALEDKRISRVWRALANYYQDTRPLTKSDNSGGLSGTGDINIYTFGVDWTQVWKQPVVKTDLLLRAAAQTGEWGQQNHSGHSYGIEGGFQILRRWMPWFRLGYAVGSGDGNAGDNKHETWFPGLPGGRIHASTPFYNTMNVEDAFAVLMLTPSIHWGVRVEYHNLRLNRSQDSWYSGSGAFNNSNFGVTGRPSNGNRHLADVFDISVTFKPHRQFQVNVYKSWVKGGSVVRSIYPGDYMSLFLVEATWQF